MDIETLEKENLIYLVILLIPTIFFLLLLLVIAISNLFVLRSLKDYKYSVSQPPISVLVPARNEEEVIGACVKSLLDQNYPVFEVCVLDDDSNDGTWQILKNLATHDPRLKISKGAPLPNSWLGKHWACHQLALKAEGDMLLFTDADTVHQSSMLQMAVAAMETERADLISALPRQIMASFIEMLVMPFSYWSIMAFLPLSIAYHNQNTLLSSATGQFMLFRRSAYEQIGGFASVKQKVVDDVELCRMVRSNGLRWRLLDGRDGYRVRQYKSFKELIEGHTKNLFAGFGNNIAVYILIWTWLLITFLLPVLSLIIWLTCGCNMILLQWLSVAGVVISLTTWAIAYAKFNFPLYLALFYPVIILFMFLIAMDSMILNLSRKATWKGRIMSGKI